MLQLLAGTRQRPCRHSTLDNSFVFCRSIAPGIVPLLLTELLTPLQDMTLEHTDLHAHLVKDIELAVAEVAHGQAGTAEATNQRCSPVQAAKPAGLLREPTMKPRAAVTKMDEFGFDETAEERAPKQQVQPRTQHLQAPLSHKLGILSKSRQPSKLSSAPRRSILKLPAKETPVVAAGGGHASSKASAALQLGGGSSATRSRISRYRRGSSGRS